MSNKISLDDYLENSNSHCFRCIKAPGEKLNPEVRKKIKRTITTVIGRDMTNEEYNIFQVFTGIKKEARMYGIRIHVGTSEFGMIHTLERHFRENGEKNGGKIDYIDIIKIPTILKTITPLFVNYKYVYTYEEDGRKLILVKYKFKERWWLKTLYSSDKS